MLHIIRELLSFEPTSTGTDIAAALEYFTNAQKRRCTAFLISDCISPWWRNKEAAQTMEKAFMITANRHDINLIQIYDRRDAEMPNVGLLKVKDAETGKRIWVDTAVESVRKAYDQEWQDQQASLQLLMTRTGTNSVSIRTDDDFVKKLMQLFKVRLYG